MVAGIKLLLSYFFKKRCCFALWDQKPEARKSHSLEAKYKGISGESRPLHTTVNMLETKQEENKYSAALYSECNYHFVPCTMTAVVFFSYLSFKQHKRKETTRLYYS